MVLEEEGDACGDEQAAEEEVELEHRLEPEGGLVTLALALALALTPTPTLALALNPSPNPNPSPAPNLEPEEGLVHHAHAQVGAEELEDVRVRVR